MRKVVRAGFLPACLAVMALSKPLVAGQDATPSPAPQPAPAGAVRVGSGIKAPTMVKRVNPEYPAEARAAGVQGIVILEAVIGTDGKVTDARVLRGNEMLTEAALTAVKQWAYAPTILNGTAVPVVMTVTVNFAMNNSANLPASPDLTGTWQGDDGGVFQIRTTGNDLFWIATYSGPSAANVFHGVWSSGGTFSGRWAEVPPSAGRNEGRLAVRVLDENTLQQVTSTNGFPAKTLTRIDPPR